ncbi:MAG TPA: hypothetical protein VFV34_28720 [Blastocatellia bacterium]|nr:hypothetical protein [Blastocatellia bacterium]
MKCIDTNERGFSLVEITLAAAMTVMLVAGVAFIVQQNQRVFFTEAGVTDMNQNVRASIDLLTRDIQSAGMGFARGTSPSATGNFAAIYYTNGANGAPDTIMAVNGDPFAPIADVTDIADGSATFFLTPPSDVVATGSGANMTFTYKGLDNKVYDIYRDHAVDNRRYIVYDDTNAMVFDITKDAQMVANGGQLRIQLQHNPTASVNVPSVFGSLLDTEEPDYPNSRVAILGATIGYRLNTATRELERTEDLVNWYSVARGITDFQIQYRVLTKDVSNAVIETITDAPANRRDIRSVIFTISAETADVPNNTPSYRQIIHRFEAAPRNLNMLHNNNLNQGDPSLD